MLIIAYAQPSFGHQSAAVPLLDEAEARLLDNRRLNHFFPISRTAIDQDG